MLSLFCSSTIAVFATTEKVSNNFLGIETSLGIKVNTDITKEKARVYADIMRQLEAQGQTALFEHFKEAIAPEIEAEIYAKYGIEPSAAKSTTYTLSNGGVVGYHNSIGGYVLSTYLTPSQFNKHIAEESTKTTVGKIINAIIGYKAPTGWGAIYSALCLINTIIRNAEVKNVLNNGGYGEIMNVSDISGANKGSTIMIWRNHPKAVVPAGSLDVHVQRF